jgi:hypothetical protein
LGSDDVVRKLAANAAAALLVLVTTAFITAPAAQAATTCSGTYVSGSRMNTYNPSNGNLIAITDAFRGNGNICVVTVKQNGYYGKLTYMQLWVYQGGKSPHDAGNFYYQAGPVTVPNSGCIHYELDLWNGPVPGGGVNIAQDYDYVGINC